LNWGGYAIGGYAVGGSAEPAAAKGGSPEDGGRYAVDGSSYGGGSGDLQV
jgi:hypothetical protein